MLDLATKSLAELTDCGFLDVNFFLQIYQKCEENEIYLDLKEIRDSYGMHINHFISEGLYLLAEKFLQKYKYKIEETLNIQDLERYKEENDLYETFINCLDSHLWFHNEKIQFLFENSEFYYR